MKKSKRKRLRKRTKTKSRRHHHHSHRIKHKASTNQVQTASERKGNLIQAQKSIKRNKIESETVSPIRTARGTANWSRVKTAAKAGQLNSPNMKCLDKTSPDNPVNESERSSKSWGKVRQKVQSQQLKSSSYPVNEQNKYKKHGSPSQSSSSPSFLKKILNIFKSNSRDESNYGYHAAVRSSSLRRNSQTRKFYEKSGSRFDSSDNSKSSSDSNSSNQESISNSNSSSVFYSGSDSETESDYCSDSDGSESSSVTGITVISLKKNLKTETITRTIGTQTDEVEILYKTEIKPEVKSKRIRDPKKCSIQIPFQPQAEAQPEGELKVRNSSERRCSRAILAKRNSKILSIPKIIPTTRSFSPVYVRIS